MKTPTTMSFAIAVVLWATAAPMAHAAEWWSPWVGGGGGTNSKKLDCGSSGVLVGVTAKKGQWLDALGIECRKLNANGSLGGYFTIGPYGGSGGGADSVRCRDGYVGSKVKLYATGGGPNYVMGLWVMCARWKPDSKNRVGNDLERLTLVGHHPITGDAYESFCPERSAVIKGLQIRYGGYVDRARYFCDDWNR